MKIKNITNRSIDKRLIIRKCVILSWSGISAMNYLSQGWTLTVLSIAYLVYAAMIQSDFDMRIPKRKSERERITLEASRWLIFATLIADLSQRPFATFSACLIQPALLIVGIWTVKYRLLAFTYVCIPLTLMALTMFAYLPKQGVIGLASIPILILTLKPISQAEK